MNTNGHGSHLPSGGLTYEIVGSAMAVLNEVGHGFHEKPYENGLVVELGLRRLSIRQQPSHPILYKGVPIGEYIPDQVINHEVIVETKVITDHERGQMLNYLRITKLKVGIILNFAHSKLEWERIVL